MQTFKLTEEFFFNGITIIEDGVATGGYLFPKSIPKEEVLEIKNDLEESYNQSIKG